MDSLLIWDYYSASYYQRNYNNFSFGNILDTSPYKHALRRKSIYHHSDHQVHPLYKDIMHKEQQSGYFHYYPKAYLQFSNA